MVRTSNNAHYREKKFSKADSYKIKLNEYVTLGRSGLRVSPFCLGTMTFGTEWGWGADEESSRAMFNRYLEKGGNFVDTADGYTNGKSEQLVGKFLQETKARDKVVLATKFTFSGEPGNPNAGGNGRKNIYRAIEGSLRRLQTDYIDLYWMHAWDMITPVEEVVASLDTLVQDGKIRHFGFSDVPAWYAARAYTLAEQQGRERIIALQLEYSLIERNIEREHIPAAQELEIGICPWSPLGNGLLSGKYKREDPSGPSQGRLDTLKKSGGALFERFTERNWNIVDILLEISKHMGRPAAEIALNWVATQPGVTSTILGMTKVAQLDSNLGSLDFTIPAELRARLEKASELDPTAHPYVFFGPKLQARIRGDLSIRPWTRSNA
jgi:aryl-alcohol dehydrogenase-like predicted oxidoreductase